MARTIAEWIWRTTLVCMLAWIGWELHQVREAMLQPAEDVTTVSADAEEIQRGIDDVRADVASLTDKVDAIAYAMVRRR